MRGELETGTDCYILTQSSSDHSGTSFSSWLGCSTVGHWGLKPSVWSWSSLRWHPTSNCNWNWLTQAVCSTWLYNCLTSTCFLWAYTSATITKFNHVHRSRWYSDIFDRMHLFRCSSAYLHRCISWLTARSRVNMLQKQWLDKCYSDSAPSEIAVKRWYDDFKRGRTDTNDAERSGCINSAVVPENTKKFHKLFWTDRKLKLREIAVELKISGGYVFTILHEHLFMRKLCSK